MTIILVHNENRVRVNALIIWVNKMLGTNYSHLSQIINNPDIHIINNSPFVSIKIEEIKQFQKEMIYRPFQNAVQIGIIFHSDLLTSEAQNALLKTLEEPGEQTHYILLVENERNLLPTILSRAKKYYPKEDELQEEQIVTDDSGTSILDPEDLINAFGTIETLVEQESEDKGTIELTLSNLEKLYEKKLHSAIDSGDKKMIEHCSQKVENILIAKKRLRMNVNKRLLLENLVLQLRS